MACDWDAINNICVTAAAVCSSLMDQTNCSAAPNCLWSAVDGTCYDKLGSCSEYASNQMACEADVEKSCVWNPVMSQCDPPAVVCSTQNANQSGCEAAPNCIYSTVDSTCYDKVPCGSYANQNSCEADDACVYSVAATTCYVRQTPCSGYAEQNPCEADLGCMWYLGACTDAGGGCSSYNGNQMDCEAASVCVYSTMDMTCYDKLASCNLYTIENQCIADIGKSCNWNVSVCEDPMADPCLGYNGVQPSCEADHNCYWQAGDSTCHSCVGTSNLQLGCFCSSGTECLSNNCAGDPSFCQP